MQPTVSVSGEMAHKMSGSVNCVKRGGQISTAARRLEAEVYSISVWLEQIRPSVRALKGRDGILYW